MTDERDGDERASGAFVTLRSYLAVAEAELDRMALESAGIEVRLMDTGTAAIVPHVGTAISVRLQVREDALAQAKKVLESTPAADADEKAAHPELGGAPGKDDKTWRAQVSVDADAQRAFRAAIIGLFLCPGLAHLYAAWLLASLWPKWDALSPAGRRNGYAALAIVSLVLVGGVAGAIASQLR